MPRILIFIITLVLLIFPATRSMAFWVWTPETGKWENPRFSVKDTPKAQLDYAVGFYNDKKYEEAIQEFKKLIKHYPRSYEAPEAQYYIGKTLQDQHKPLEAFKEYQQVIDKYPFSERSAEIVKIQYQIGLDYLEGRSDKKGLLGGIVAMANEDQIVDIFRTVIKNAPYGEFAAPAQYKIGLFLMEKKLYVEARDEFEKVINDYPQSEWVKAAKYQIALTDAKRSTTPEYDQKVTGAAVSEFKDFVTANPDAELSEKAKSQIQQLREKEAENNFLVAKFYEKQKNYTAAKIYYKLIIDDYANTKWSSKALEKYRAMGMKK